MIRRGSLFSSSSSAAAANPSTQSKQQEANAPHSSTQSASGGLFPGFFDKVSTAKGVPDEPASPVSGGYVGGVSEVIEGGLDEGTSEEDLKSILDKLKQEKKVDGSVCACIPCLMRHAIQAREEAETSLLGELQRRCMPLTPPPARSLHPSCSINQQM